ncbi:hypothetical protein Leryth_008400 [Lithospermum erythrorhizon]|nr:hypothetical protein Leryth_008400 [Lithospermum erythrorhizon]
MSSLLKTRSVVRFSGPDTVKFLQGLITNDVNRLVEPPQTTATSAYHKPVYAATLTAQGRFLYDMFIYRPDQKLSGPEPGPLELFADVDGSVLDELLVTLKKYRLRSKVDIDSVAEEFSCWQKFGKNLGQKTPSEEEPDVADPGWGGGADEDLAPSALSGNYGWRWYKDPRLDCLGFRGIFPSNITPQLVEADKETVEENYLLWRMEKGVAEGSLEIPKGEAIPLEYNLAGLNAISFDKGCYVGQELIARTHHRGVIRKRLVPVRFTDDNGNDVDHKVALKSEVIDTASNKKLGFVTTALGSRGLGILRIEEAFRNTGSLTIQGQEDIKVEAIRPEWWPVEWFLDHQQTAAA